MRPAVAWLRRPLEGSHDLYVLLESRGNEREQQSERFVGFLSEMLETGVIDDAAIANSAREARDFWAVREAPAEFSRILPGRLSFEISFALVDVGDAARACVERGRAEWPDCTCLVYAHLGDGNIHLSAQFQGWSRQDREAVKALIYGVVGEYVVTALEALPGVAAAVPGLTIMLDSGVRRGSDVLKALALDAKAVFVGRSFSYAAAVAGSAGVAPAIGIVQEEIRRNMALLGINRIAELHEDLLVRVGHSEH